MWVTDLIQAVPGLLLVILINTTLRRPIINAFDTLYMQTRDPFFLNTLWLDYVLVFSALALIGWRGLASWNRRQRCGQAYANNMASTRWISRACWRSAIRGRESNPDSS